jgi:hypothetical protein
MGNNHKHQNEGLRRFLAEPYPLGTQFSASLSAKTINATAAFLQEDDRINVEIKGSLAQPQTCQT